MLWSHDRNEVESSPTANNLQKTAHSPRKIAYSPENHNSNITQTQMVNQWIDPLILSACRSPLLEVLTFSLLCDKNMIFVSSVVTHLYAKIATVLCSSSNLMSTIRHTWRGWLCLLQIATQPDDQYSVSGSVSSQLQASTLQSQFSFIYFFTTSFIHHDFLNIYTCRIN